MKGDKSVLEHLQKALTMELAAVRQYLLHSHVLDDWGLDKLAAQMKQEMQEELGHADKLIARMMFLEGEPDMTSADGVARAQGLKDMFEADLRDEYEARSYYTKAASDAQQAGDIGTQELFHSLIRDEEGHIDHLETQIALLERLGEPAYMQMQISGNAEE